jgi:glycosyltransferase involved in cell wall biosynthesis
MMDRQQLPRISVLMTTYNGAAFIRETIASVLAQSFSDFELIIIDDSSTDETPAILAACTDGRLRSIRTPNNLGITGARNFGFAECRGTYIAALDHDDLAMPERLAIQCAYLDANPGIVLAGSEIRISQNGALHETDHQPGAMPPGGQPLLLRWMLHVDNPLTWSSVMVRREAIERLGIFVRPDYELADDFDLYHRLLSLGGIVRLDQPLTLYRWHAANTSHAKADELLNAAARVLAAAYAPWLGAEAGEAALLAARHCSAREPPPDVLTLRRLGDVLERLLAGFCADYASDAGNRAAIQRHAARLWWRLARAAIRAGTPAAIRAFYSRPALRHGFTPAGRDVLESLAIGTARTRELPRRLLAAMRR